MSEESVIVSRPTMTIHRDDLERLLLELENLRKVHSVLCLQVDKKASIDTLKIVMGRVDEACEVLNSYP